ncbi:MAG: hypothetical protein H6Q26_3485 [Bacteroidetes bacterium]|nr:hypothetical protein [Bacteroidota bacterium]
MMKNNKRGCIIGYLLLVVNKREAHCASPSAILKPDQFNQEYLYRQNNTSVLFIFLNVCIQGNNQGGLISMLAFHDLDFLPVVVYAI